MEDPLTGVVTAVPQPIYHVLRETRLTDLSYFSAKDGSTTYYPTDQVLLCTKRWTEAL